jgi:hypothetical protein
MRGHLAALLVQYERTGDRGNLRRAFVRMPTYYLRRALALVVRGPRPGDRVLIQEVLGAGAGVLYYVWARYVRRSRGDSLPPPAGDVRAWHPSGAGRSTAIGGRG